MSVYEGNVRLIKVWWLTFIIFLSRSFTFTDSRLYLLYPDSNEVVFETEHVFLICEPPSNVSSVNVSVSDAQGSYIVKHNEYVGLNEEDEFAVLGHDRLLLQILANTETRSSLRCVIFENGIAVSENHLILDIRPKDHQPACFMSAGPAVAIGDAIELTCYEALVSTTGVWRKTKDNGISYVDLPTTVSPLPNPSNRNRRKYISSITVAAEDDSSVFQCDVDGERCQTDEIIIVTGLMIEFISQNPETIRINDRHMVECNASHPSAQITWSHSYETNSDIRVRIFNDSFLNVTLLSDTALHNGLILNFTCVATLGRFEASGTYQFVVDLVSNPTQESTTSTVMRTLTAIKKTTQVAENNTKSTIGGTGDELPLYYIIGGIIAIILIAMIIIILITLCVVQTKDPKEETKERSNPSTVPHVSDCSEGASPDRYYSEVSRDTNRARAISNPDGVYSDVNKGHVLIDEEEIYNENLNWGNE